ncbi:MAG: hypothetical protein JOZ29_21760 [Deltaproteobacteria bacterium]|nr:hypothetical protein [Deltaproteobacteria bacterium]
MAEQRQGLKSASATMNPKDQNIEMIHRVVGGILGRGGCPTCGRIAVLHVEFVSDPPPELTKENVVSFATQGF